MRRFSFFETKVSLGHVLLLNAVTIGIVALFIVGITGVGAATPDSFSASGTVRIASAQTAGPGLIAGGDGNVVVMAVQFTVPSGKKADILASFQETVMSADLAAAVGLCFGTMRLDATNGPDLLPGSQVMLDKGVDNGSGYYGEARGIQSRKLNVGAGLHTLYVIAFSGGNGCYYGQGSTFVIANIHS
jgi:hypothetical protein